MIAPYYMNETKSDMRGIKAGWYAIEDNGTLYSGPFSSFEECVNRIAQPTNGDLGVLSRNDAGSKNFLTDIRR